MGIAVQITQQTGVGYGPDGDVSPYETEALLEADKLIRDGLPRSSERLTTARRNEAYYQMQNRRYIEKREAESDLDYMQRPKVCSRMTRKAVSTLCRKLYGNPPVRTIEREEELDESLVGYVEEWLLDAYKAAKIDTVLMAADRKAIINDVAAIQIACTGKPKEPVRLYTFGGDEFEVFCPPDDPCNPWGVVTINVQPSGKDRKRRIYTFWTAEKKVVYQTDEMPQSQSSGGEKAQLVSEEPNPYGELPFVFFHNEEPVDGFWGGGIGTALAETNAEVDKTLSDLADQIRIFACPDMFTRNIASTWRYEKKPGRPQRLVSTAAAEAGDMMGAPAEIFYLQPQILVEDTWRHIERLIQATFFDLDVPLNAVRDNGSSPTSGLQVLAEQIPLLDYLKARQRYVAKIETTVAKKILSMAGRFYELYDKIPGFLELVDAVEIDLVWSSPSLPVPTPERNQEDQWKLEFALVSPVELIMQQRGVTREQAEAIMKQIAEDNRAWKETNGEQGAFGQGSPLGSPNTQGEIGSIDTSQPPPTLNAEGEAENEAADEMTG